MTEEHLLASPTSTRSATLTPTATSTKTPTVEPTQIPINEYVLTKILEPQGIRGSVDELVFSADGSLLASSASDHIINIWDTNNFCLKNQLISSVQNYVTSIAFSPDQTRVASSYFGGTGILLWNLEEATRENQLETYGVEPHASLVGPKYLKFLNNSTLFAQGTTAFEILSIPNGVLGKQMDVDNLEDSILSPDGRLMAGSSYSENDIFVWDTSNFELIFNFDQPDGDPYQNRNLVHFSSDSTWLAFTYKSTVSLWKVGAVAPGFTLSADRDIERFGAIIFSPDDRYLIGSTYVRGASPSGQVYIWDLSTKERIAVLPHFLSGIVASSAVAISPDGRFLVLGAEDGKILVISNQLVTTDNPPACDPAVTIEKEPRVLPETEVLSDFSGISSPNEILSLAEPANDFNYTLSQGGLLIYNTRSVTDSGISLVLDKDFEDRDTVVFQADLRLTSKTTGAGQLELELWGRADEVAFLARCMLITYGEYNFLNCNYEDDSFGYNRVVYEANTLYDLNSLQRGQKETWYTLSIVLIKSDNRFEFYRGDLLLGEYRIPGEAANFSGLEPVLGLWVASGDFEVLFDNIIVSR